MPASLDDQLELLSDWGIVDNSHRFNASSQLIHLDKLLGRGSFERYEFGNLTLSRVNCQFLQTRILKNDHCYTDYILYVLLEGRYELIINSHDHRYINSDSKTHQTNAIELIAPSIWIFQGNLGELIATIPADESIKAFYIELDNCIINDIISQLDENRPLFTNNTDCASQSLPPPHDCSYLVLSKLLDTTNFFKLPITSNPIMDALFQQAWQLFRTPSPNNEMTSMVLQGQTLSFTSQLLMQRYETLVATDDNALPAYALQAKLILDQFYNQNWSISQIAQKVGTNECYLKKAFKQLTSQTLGQYRTSRRMQAALPLLAQGHKVAKVAQLTGFNSNDYFIKVFTKHFGYSPSQVIK